MRLYVRTGGQTGVGLGFLGVALLIVLGAPVALLVLLGWVLVWTVIGTAKALDFIAQTRQDFTDKHREDEDADAF